MSLKKTYATLLTELNKHGNKVAAETAKFIHQFVENELLTHETGKRNGKRDSVFTGVFSNKKDNEKAVEQRDERIKFLAKLAADLKALVDKPSEFQTELQKAINKDEVQKTWKSDSSIKYLSELHSHLLKNNVDYQASNDKVKQGLTAQPPEQKAAPRDEDEKDSSSLAAQLAAVKLGKGGALDPAAVKDKPKQLNPLIAALGNHPIFRQRSASQPEIVPHAGVGNATAVAPGASARSLSLGSGGK